MTSKSLSQPASQQLNYQQIGQGEHIVLIHGLFGSLENLNMVAKSLSDQYCVTSIDVRNHGNSFHQEGMQYEALAQDVINLLATLTIECCHILGHSMGGKIAMQIALSHPEKVKKLIIADIAPVVYPAHHLTIIKGLQAIELNNIKNRKEADKQLANYVETVSVRQFLLRNLVIKKGEDSNEKEHFTFKCNLTNIEQGYPQIMQGIDLNNSDNTAPFQGETLFIKGGNSDYILPIHQDSIHALFPQAKAKIIQGAGHWLHAEKTVIFNKIVKNFLRSEIT